MLISNSIRLRLTLWYAGSLALILLVFATGTYFYVRDNLFSQVEQRINNELALIRDTLDKPLDEYKELELHGFLHLFKVEEANWPVYISTGWDDSDLNYALSNTSQTQLWIWQSANGDFFHIKQQIVEHNGLTYTLTVAQNSTQIHLSLHRLLLAFLIAAPLGVMTGLLGGYFLAGRSLSPIQRLTERARMIGAENLSQRLSVQNDKDELGQLTRVLNDMFARLELSFEQLRRFTQDAAHELRTPLAVLRGVGEVGLQEQRDPLGYREVIGSMLEEVDRMARMVDGLLTLARAESGRIVAKRQPEDIGELCREVVDCLRVLAEEKHQTMQFQLSHAITAVIDRNILNLALMNLIANAIRFTPKRGTIIVRVEQHTDTVIIEVQDNGPGIAKEHHARLFERFYRVDRSRAQETGGTGLGLAIALWAVEVNNGRIEVKSTEGEGSIFKIILQK